MHPAGQNGGWLNEAGCWVDDAGGEGTTCSASPVRRLIIRSLGVLRTPSVLAGTDGEHGGPCGSSEALHNKARSPRWPQQAWTPFGVGDATVTALTTLLALGRLPGLRDA